MFKYKRIILKLSGEALKSKDLILSKEVLDSIVKVIKELIIKYKTQIAIVVGGGNIWRGDNIQKLNIKIDENAHYMGMIATSLNALGLYIYFKQNEIPVEIQNSFSMEPIIELLNKQKARKVLDDGKVLIFGGGTGRPFLSTDTAVIERAIDINADVILMAKNDIDGVYDSDPKYNKSAKFIENITYQEMIDKNLEVVDYQAMEMLIEKNKNIDILIFNMNKIDNLLKLFTDVTFKKSIISKIKKGE